LPAGALFHRTGLSKLKHLLWKAAAGVVDKEASGSYIRCYAFRWFESAQE
jgi:hypothetical protein